MVKGVTHFYVSRHYSSGTVKLLCTKESVPHDKKDPFRASTVPHRVTCPDCLKIIIPKKEIELAEMRRNMEARDAAA